MADVIILGAGGHARVVADIVLRQGHRVLGFLDDAPTAEGAYGIALLGPIDDYKKWPDARFAMGIGSAAVRRKLASRMVGVQWHTAIHPSAVISPLGTVIGEGSVVMAGAVVNPGAKIGCHCIINTGAVVEHDNDIRDYVHISVGAKLAGAVTIEENTWVGIGAVVSNCLTVCGDCMLGAGTVVVKDIDTPGTYVGVPARRLP